MNASPVWSSLPECVLQVADLFWYQQLQEEDRYHRMDIDEDFGLHSSHHDYFPESPYQTPIYWILQSQLKNYRLYS